MDNCEFNVIFNLNIVVDLCNRQAAKYFFQNTNVSQFTKYWSQYNNNSTVHMLMLCTVR